MNAPVGTTQTQADYIFYNQVVAGSLVDFAAGQSIGGTSAQAIKFTLSRLDRGTAGVDDTVILSIINGLPTISGYPDLINVPLENPITQANLANIKFNNTYTPPSIGPLNSSQVQGLLAQIANYVDQPVDTMTNEIGVGQYGLDCQQLEMAGYVKPGTYRQFIFDPSPLVDVLSAPGIWTGRNGISSAQQFLNNPASQNDAMTTLMTQSYNSLTAIGTITPPIAPSATALVGQVYTQSGLQTLSQLSSITGISIPSTSGLSIAGTPIAGLLSTPLKEVGSLASGALNSANLFNNVGAITTKLESTIANGVGSLVTNASKFGTSAATQWANGLTSGLTSGLPPGLSGSIGGITNGLTNQLTGSLGGLTTDLTNNIQNLNVLGKASEFASGFSNPLSGLNNLGDFNLSSITAGLPSISDLTSKLPDFGSLTGSLPSLSSLTAGLPGLSSLTSLSSLNLGSLSSLGNFGSLSSIPGLGSLGDIGGLFGGGGDSLVSSTQVAAGYTNTVNRSVVDTAFKKILGNPKIPTPKFDYPSTASASSNASIDIAFAQEQLQTVG